MMEPIPEQTSSRNAPTARRPVRAATHVALRTRILKNEDVLLGRGYGPDPCPVRLWASTW
jgi:hypothetical protein